MYIPLPHLSIIAWVFFVLGCGLTLAGCVQMIRAAFMRTGHWADLSQTLTFWMGVVLTLAGALILALIF